MAAGCDLDRLGVHSKRMGVLWRKLGMDRRMVGVVC